MPLGPFDSDVGTVAIVDAPLGGPTVSSGPVVTASPAWRFDLCEGGASNPTAGTFIATLDPYCTDRQFVFDLNRPCSVTGKIASDSSVVNSVYGDGYPYLNEGNRTLKCYRYESGDWVLRFAGILWTVGDEGDVDMGYTSFTAFDPYQFLFRRMIRRNDGNLKKTVTLANNAAAAVKRHIDKTIEFAGPCYIDTSDGFFEPALVYLTMQYEQEYLARAFSEVTDTGVVDIIMDPVDRTDGILVTANAVSQRGDDKSGSVQFQWDVGSRGVSEWKRDLDMDTLANSITNFSGDKKLTSFVEDSTSQGIYGVMEDARVLTDILHQDSLDALTEWELSMRKDPRENIAVLPLPETGSFVFDDYFLGDIVTVECSSNAREAVSGQQRIYGITLDVDDEGVERVTELRVSPAG